MSKNYLVFTDLDGTLLDHQNYSHVAAKPALDLLSSQKIPVILNSSKTIKEIEHIASDLNLNDPIIAENGSLIFYPKTGEAHDFGEGYSRICEVLIKLRKQYCYKFIGFNDWTTKQIAKDTGLSISDASRAAMRQGSEPIRWLEDEIRLEDFRNKLLDSGLTLNRGGRYWHVMWHVDKAQAMEHLIKAYSKNNHRPITIALGDGPNDKNMLAIADIAVIVHNPYGVKIDLPFKKDQRVIQTLLEGPIGWNDAIHQIINV